MWLVFYFSSITTLIWLFFVILDIQNYDALFNLYKLTEIYLWPVWNFIIFFILFILSLIILFSFSPILFTKKVLFVWKNIKDNIKKDSNKIKNEISQTTKTVKENRQKEKLEKMMEKLKEEKLSLAKSKQPKQIQRILDLKFVY